MRNRSRSFEGPATGNRSPFRFGSTTSDGGGRALCSPLGWVYPVYPSGTHLSVFLPLSFSLLSFSTSSRGRRSTIDDDTRIRPGSSTDRSTERPGESVKTDEAVAMRPFYTDPHLHLLSYFFVVLLLVVVVVLFLRLFAPYLPTYLPTYLLFSTWLDRVFSPFLRRARAHCTHEQFTPVVVSENFCIHLQKKRERKREGHIASTLFKFSLSMFPTNSHFP